MFASQFISDAAPMPPRPPRGSFGLQPNDDKPDSGRRRGLITGLRGFLAAHAHGQVSPARGIGR